MITYDIEAHEGRDVATIDILESDENPAIMSKTLQGGIKIQRDGNDFKVRQ